MHPAQAARQRYHHIDGKRNDDLLNIRSQADLQVLMLEDNKAKRISDVHMTMLREWVNSGGVLWVAGEGLDSALAQTIAPFRSESFEFVRSSSGKRGGELIVRGVSPRMTIEDHVMTEGVSRLYLFARSKFDGTQRADLLVRMGDTEGNSGWGTGRDPGRARLPDPGRDGTEESMALREAQGVRRGSSQQPRAGRGLEQLRLGPVARKRAGLDAQQALVG